MSGDWVNIGRSTATRLISNGEARIIGGLKLDIDTNSGVLLRGQSPDNVNDLKLAKDLPVKVGEPHLAFGNTLILMPGTKVPHNLLGAGFGLLKRWEVAVPIMDGYPLASATGSAKDLEQTKAVIRDLRIPLPNTNVIFVRQCPTTEQLISQWNEERKKGDERLAWLRVVYQVKPLILALPPVWAVRL